MLYSISHFPGFLQIFKSLRGPHSPGYYRDLNQIAYLSFSNRVGMTALTNSVFRSYVTKVKLRTSYALDI